MPRTLARATSHGAVLARHRGRRSTALRAITPDRVWGCNAARFASNGGTRMWAAACKPGVAAGGGRGRGQDSRGVLATL